MGWNVRWGIVWTIFRREARDQLRDPRTLFMVLVLPLLLYPILGIGILRLSAMFDQKPRTVVVLGAENLPASPPLLNAGRDGFEPSLFSRPRDVALLKVEQKTADWDWSRPGAVRKGIRGGLAEAVVMIPPDVKGQIESVGSARLPVLYDSTDEPSQITYLRVREVLEQWRDAIVKSRLARDKKPPGYTEPVEVEGEDVAPEDEIGGSIWGRIFPFLLVIMALTGAFNPAVDLCAGEKERGTMETLLISPAGRSEIVLGKFFTVMMASMATALLNLLSMGLTGIQLAGQVAGMGPKTGSKMATLIAPPSPTSYFWMMLLLIPLSAFFAALCVALATMARSMKEGQYYMTPLYMVSLPLILVTLAPEVTLTLFYSMVPITGVSLLLKALILGDYDTARRYFLPVLLPTLVYAWLALRWAVDLFQREGVVFREAEAFSLKSWLKHLIRDKEPTPGGGSAIFCFALMLSLAWFSMQWLGNMTSAVQGMVLGHLAFILGPPVVLAFLLTSDPVRTLRLRRARLVDLALAAGLAFSLNPIVREVAFYAEKLFPTSEALRSQLAQMAEQIPNLGVAVLVFALMPAITEELAFRGYILTGLERTYSKGAAIVLSALLFGFLHVLLSLFQQLFGATLLGLVIGLIAIKSRSLWPGVVFHFINNALGLLTVEAAGHPKLATLSGWLFRDTSEALYRPPVLVAATLISLVLLALVRRGGDPKGPGGSTTHDALSGPARR
jgi:sodium transport system permease protein